MTAATGNLREPEQMDWDNHNPKSNYTPPPDVLEADGTPITFQATLPKDLGAPEKMGVSPEGYRTFEFGPLQVKAPNGKTFEVRFFTQSVKKFQGKDGQPINVSGVSKILRAAGFQGKPNSNKEYEQAVAAIRGRTIPVTLEWRARNRDNGEEVRGYANFPLDTERPGRRKAILKAGDKLSDGTEVKSEVLFANAQVRYVLTK